MESFATDPAVLFGLPSSNHVVHGQTAEESMNSIHRANELINQATRLKIFINAKVDEVILWCSKKKVQISASNDPKTMSFPSILPKPSKIPS
ncbi:hypothetical protein EGR_09546 [Echinococcus granulosus]|uniref:Uncharacterized protein n=1 Tax=Echinococcus granulosus TaxID=6210 RepID=W6U4W5_ECHGR|nr:hypothetical protein EGR_09546 [Echinococcus granulosus]EUB55606.1 hypothetical protein EGR_09546 [Echinococcus granulosus]